MITTMTKYSFILLKGEKDGFLDRLQELGVVDISRSQKPVDDISGRIVADIDETRAKIKCITAGSDSHLVELQGDRLSLARKLDEVSVWGGKTLRAGSEVLPRPEKTVQAGMGAAVCPPDSRRKGRQRMVRHCRRQCRFLCQRTPRTGQDCGRSAL